MADSPLLAFIHKQQLHKDPDLVDTRRFFSKIVHHMVAGVYNLKLDLCYYTHSTSLCLAFSASV